MVVIDDLLHTYKQTTVGYSELSRVLSEMLPRADDFNDAVDQLTMKLHQETEKGAARTRGIFEEGVDHVHDSMSGLASSLQGILGSFMAKSSALDEVRCSI